VQQAAGWGNKGSAHLRLVVHHPEPVGRDPQHGLHRLLPALRGEQRAGVLRGGGDQSARRVAVTSCGHYIAAGEAAAGWDREVKAVPAGTEDGSSRGGRRES